MALIECENVSIAYEGHPVVRDLSFRVEQNDFPTSVFEVVLSGRLNTRGIRPFYTNHDKEIARANMKVLGIEEMTKQCFCELSGGL